MAVHAKKTANPQRTICSGGALFCRVPSQVLSAKRYERHKAGGQPLTATFLRAVAGRPPPFGGVVAVNGVSFPTRSRPWLRSWSRYALERRPRALAACDPRWVPWARCRSREAMIRLRSVLSFSEMFSSLSRLVSSGRG